MEKTEQIECFSTDSYFKERAGSGTNTWNPKHLRDSRDQKRVEPSLQRGGTLLENQSRNNWLKLGDRHTKVFYAAAKQRLARNRIMAIEDDLGMIHRGDENNGVVASDYFVDLFKIRLRFVLTCCLTQVPNVIADLLSVDGLS